jgi:hypothetical protein
MSSGNSLNQTPPTCPLPSLPRSRREIGKEAGCKDNRSAKMGRLYPFPVSAILTKYLDEKIVDILQI